ncbi:hypothetical protein BV375_26160 [Nostoc sp. 106C]|nr:hypothetical protein BV375_26160 [Nostoc sp. 106C]
MNALKGLAKYDLEEKQNPIERAKFKEKLTQYLTIAREQPEHLQVWFWDESGFSLRVKSRKNWGKKGGSPRVTMLK